MKKAILNGMTVLFAILLFSSCDALIEDALQDRDTTALETERDTYVTPDESTEEPTDDPSTELATEEPMEIPTDSPTEALTEPTTEPPYEETTASTVSDEKFLQELLDRLAADGYEAEQTLLEIVHEMRSITVTAALNGRIFRPGDTVEVSLSNMKYYGEDFIMAPDNGKVTLYPPPGDRLIRMTTEDYVTFTATIPEDTEPGICWIYVFFEGIDEMPLCPLIVY